MLFNIIAGFVIPWVFGIYLYRKSRTIVLLIFPITVVISGLINDTGYYLEFWDFTPLIENDETLSALPLDIGLYPVMAGYLIYWIRKNNRHTLLKIGCFCLATTALEYLAFIFGKVEYSNHWNIGWTFVSYLLAYSLVYLYYRLLVRYGYWK
ncbi:CBO0543 family protein [Paenibacillus sp. P36]|uniref:CBO0543 family protein n=1 Tax=Paenibacillus sp. P36 TaxID=3342538 RepID=UPI0038B3D06A